MSPLFLALVVIFMAGLDEGEPSLRWLDTTQTLNAAPSAEQAAAAFRFVNETDRPVTITRVRSSCGCTVATLDKTVYQPGERGEIRVTFRFDDRVGRHAKRITVETDGAGDDSAPPRTDLTLTVPQLVRLTPPALHWTLPREGEDSEPEGSEAEAAGAASDDQEAQERTGALPRLGSEPAPPAAAAHETDTPAGAHLPPQSVRIDMPSEHPIQVLAAAARRSAARVAASP